MSSFLGVPTDKVNSPSHSNGQTSNNSFDGGCHTPLTPGADVDYTAAPSTVTNHYDLDPVQFARLRDVANRRAARVVSSSRKPLHPHDCGIEDILAYNELFAEAVIARDERYYDRLAEQQRPDFLYIGCSDSRVVASEIMGLGPGEVFVHRNVANIISPSDLNMLAALQYSVDHLKVRHVIVSGHYKCGGVTAALYSIQLGLADHWVSHVVDVKKIHWPRMEKEIPIDKHLDALCELNVLSQVSHLVDTHIVKGIWDRQNRAEALRKEEEERAAAAEANGATTQPITAASYTAVNNASFGTASSDPRTAPETEVVIHGWVYGLDDGLIHRLVTLTRRCNTDEKIHKAEEEIFVRYGTLKDKTA